MRRYLIAANWKMNKTTGEAVEYITRFIKLVKDVEGMDIVICPPFTALGSLDNLTASTNILLGAQNMHFEKEGAYTGEISCGMLKDIGCRYVIVGHSERREFFKENDELVNKKAKKALECKLVPIICVGETAEERKAGKTEDVIKKQMHKCLEGITDAGNIVIAYEPVWAISRGDPNVKSATPEDAQKVHSYIREILSEHFGKEGADTIRILYGGSMKPDNAKKLLDQADIDGGLVGNASLDPDNFEKIINFR